MFSDRKWGERVVKLLLQTYGRRGYTLAQGLACYAPNHENDTAAYVRFVVERSGVAPAVKLAGLGEAEIARVVGSIGEFEGWEVGYFMNAG